MTIVPEENYPPTLNLTLTQNLTITGGQFSSGAIVLMPLYNSLLKYFIIRNVLNNFVSRISIVVYIKSYDIHVAYF